MAGSFAGRWPEPGRAGPARSGWRRRRADRAGRPAARCKSLEPSSQIGTFSLLPESPARRLRPRGPKVAAAIPASCSGKSCLLPGLRRNARAVIADRTRRAAQAEVDAPGIQRFQRAELFRDHQRRMVRQHDAAGTDADRRCAAGNMADQTAVAELAMPGHVVVLGQPVAVKPQRSACAPGRGTAGKRPSPCRQWSPSPGRGSNIGQNSNRPY